ncbi:amidohydrolase [Actinotalea sp.]|uniref:amidohydrolase n=1 Tax=Actinotalea sp. TaxID=1872145 RepID=UPI00356A5F6D
MSVLLRSARLVDLGQSGSATPEGAVDLRVESGRLVAVAPALEQRPGEEVVDLRGRWVLPGLWDAHVHMTQWALVRRRLDVADAACAEDVVALVVRRLRTQPVPEGELLVAFGFRDGLWPDSPTAALLDDGIAAAGLPPTPVVVICGDLHSAWLNTAAAAHLGVSPGILREDPWFALSGRLDARSDEVLDAWVDDAVRASAARGIVGIGDYEMADNLAAWQRRLGAGTRVRVSAGVWREHLDGAVARELATGDVLPGSGGLLQMGSLKVISDGSLNTFTAYCHEAYQSSTGSSTHGVLNVGPEDLLPLMAKAARHGIHAAIHAIGDRANALALDAFEASGARGSIEHAQLLDRGDIARFAALGVAASVQPEHAMDDRDVIDHYWADRADRAYPFADLHAAGVRLLLGSDAPVAPLDPWHAIAAAVSRSRDGREPWHADQDLSVRVALASSVRSAVAVGEPADLVVLDADPLTCGADLLRAMPVAGTMLAGQWTHDALGRTSGP